LKLDKKELLAMLENEGATDVIKVGGRIYRTSTRETQHGVSICFHGVFVAKNLINGEAYTSKTMYAPQVQTEQLVGMLNERKNTDDYIEFKSVWQLVESNLSGTGYAFAPSDEVAPEIQSENNALVASMLQSF
jgi:hypothetical protein